MVGYGERVGAVSHTDKDGVIHLFGYGVYKNDEIPPRGIKLMGIDLNENAMTNPQIRLDSGKIVWGCECWWGSEEAVKKQVAAHEKVVEVDIFAARKAANS